MELTWWRKHILKWGQNRLFVGVTEGYHCSLRRFNYLRSNLRLLETFDKITRKSNYIRRTIGCYFKHICVLMLLTLGLWIRGGNDFTNKDNNHIMLTKFLLRILWNEVSHHVPTATSIATWNSALRTSSSYIDKHTPDCENTAQAIRHCHCVGSICFESQCYSFVRVVIWVLLMRTLEDRNSCPDLRWSHGADWFEKFFSFFSRLWVM